MLNILFKAKRRISILSRRVVIRFRIYEYKILYKQRFKVDPSIHFGNGLQFFFDDSNSSVEIAENVLFRNHCELRTGNNGQLIIGHDNFFNNNCSIQCFSEVRIGNHCQFGEAVRIYDMNHKYKEQGKLISGQGYSAGKITIGNNCWFGSNVTILKNVTIGDNVVIGANCLVRESIPSNSLVYQGQSLVIRPLK